MNLPNLPRRGFVSSLPFFITPGLMAEALTLTPKQTEGPFYPDKMPLDTDNDLIIINDSLTPAVGTVAYLNGKVTDFKGNPIRNALVEIWQVDYNGVYLHSRGENEISWTLIFRVMENFLPTRKVIIHFVH